MLFQVLRARFLRRHCERGLALVMLIGFCASTSLAAVDSEWKPVLDRVANSVVEINVDATRGFDTNSPASARATGFVIDAERGIILTNRHVVTPGPVVAQAVFRNHEEVDIRPIYRDPVHDFGFYQYDPSEVHLLESPPALSLRPDLASIGLEIHVVGNDAGEKLSFLPGKLARLDRDAPNYGRGRYNDFNTFYYQAASGTSGGSSGSPVIDRHGNVVALNAGGSFGAQTSFYLPLDRVVRAFELIRAGRPVSRGTLQTVFRYVHIDELRRLGLSSETEQAFRSIVSGGNGLLVVDETVPDGPAFGVLEPGDILLSLQGVRITNFTQLESILDESVGKNLAIEVERGGKHQRFAVVAQNLHKITPNAYLEMGEAVFNDLSYQQARNFGVPVKGVYVAAAGYMLRRAGLPRGTVITMVGNVPTLDLDSFEKEMSRYSDGARVPLRYFNLNNSQNYNVAVVTIDRRWFKMQRCIRNDVTGLWPCTSSAEPTQTLEQRSVQALRLTGAEQKGSPSGTPTLAVVEYYIPYRTEGVHGDRFWGVGVVVDAEQGLVAVDRDTVPIALGDVVLTFEGSLELPGHVVYLHPEHNLAIVQYDPVMLGDTDVRSAKFKVGPLDPGASLNFAGLTRKHTKESRRIKIERIEAVSLPYTSPPRFREKNLEVIDVDAAVDTLGGALMDRRGHVVALWSSFAHQAEGDTDAFFAGLPAAVVQPVVEALRNKEPVRWRSLGVEWQSLNLAYARNLGLSEAAATAIEDFDPIRRRVLSVRRLTAGLPAAQSLREGDLLLRINGKPATSFEEVEKAAQVEQVSVTILRGGEELTFEIPTVALDGKGLDRAVVWAGALLHAPHLAIAEQQGITQTGVYVAYLWYGSPSDRYHLNSTERITEVDGLPTPDLSAFLAAVAGKRDRDSVRLQVVGLDGVVRVTTLKLDLQYWPTVELHRNGEGWQRNYLLEVSQEQGANPEK